MDRTLLNDVIAAAASIAKPPPKLKVSEWADCNRRLSPEASAEPGRFKTSRTPYVPGIINTLNEPTIEEIIWIASAQVAKTENLISAILYYIHQDPSPILFVLPTIELAETISKDRIAPAIRDTPAIAELMGDPKSRKSESTILHKHFPGGRLTLCGSNSPASLASRPCRIVCCDEVDRFTMTGTEGDVVNLAKKRTSTYFNRKILLTSTPTIKGISRIETSYNHTDRQKFFVPCPLCGFEQDFKFSQLKWEKDQPKTARYICESCQAAITNGQKNQMVAKGKWLATSAPSPGWEKVRGFHIWAIYSPWVSLSQIVEEFLSSKDDPQKLKVFVNTVLGETFDEDGGEGLEWQQLLARAEPYQPLSVPSGGLLLTAGVDVQGDRLSIAVWAWGKGEESWLVYWVELYGDPTESKVWEELDTVLGASYTHESGTELKITAAAIDSGFKPQEVYNYVRKRPGRNLFAVKGQSTPGKPVIGKPTLQEVTYKGQTLKKGVKLWPVGSDVAKGIIYSRLKIRSPGAGYVHFPLGIDEEFYEQLTAEKLVTRYIKGFPKREWVKTRARNEALDTYVYAYAAAVACGLVRMDWRKLESAIIPPEPTEEETKTNGKPTEKQGFTAGAMTQNSPTSRRKGNFATNW